MDQPRRVAVVTGGASGIGRSVASILARGGDHLCVLDSNVSLGQDYVAELRAAGASAEFVALDVTDRAQVGSVMADVFSAHQRLDVLVTCAGITRPGALETLDEADWSTVLGVNLDGTFHILQAAARHVIAAGGRASFVTISSVAASRGEVGRGSYCVSKAGVEALTRLAAAEWASRGIRVNCVAPGYINTPLLQAAFQSSRIVEADLLSRIPIGRLGTADEIAEVIAFLVSPKSSYISGQVLNVDGGFLIDHGVVLLEAQQQQLRSLEIDNATRMEPGEIVTK